MTFEEDFPSLKEHTGFNYCVNKFETCDLSEGEDDIFIPIAKVKEHCLDKQKVSALVEQMPCECKIVQALGFKRKVKVLCMKHSFKKELLK